MPSLREGAPFAGATSHILVAKCGPLWETMPSLREGVPFPGARLRILVVKLGFSISTRLSLRGGGGGWGGAPCVRPIYHFLLVKGWGRAS